METQEHTFTKIPAQSLAKARWGDAVAGGVNGFILVPDALIRHQEALGLTDGELVVLLNLLVHWRLNDSENLPFISPEQIARRMGGTARSVQRHIRGLMGKGFIARREPERLGPDGPMVRRFVLDGLVKAVREVAARTSVSGVAQLA